MNEDLQKALAEFVKTSLLTFQQGKDFVVAQAPDVIQQLIRWHFWLAAMSIVFEVVIIGLCGAAIRSLIRLGNENDDPVFEIVGIIISSIVALIVFGIMIFGDIPTLIQIWVAPKVWLLEWAMSQVKGS